RIFLRNNRYGHLGYVLHERGQAHLPDFEAFGVTRGDRLESRSIKKPSLTSMQLEVRKVGLPPLLSMVRRTNNQRQNQQRQICMLSAPEARAPIYGFTTIAGIF